MSEKGIMDWFGRRKEDAVRVGSRNHGIAVLDAVTEMDMCLKAMIDGKNAEAIKCIERLMLSEHEADRIEDKLCVDIAGGELSVQEREDLMHFVRKTDQIANWTKEAALHVQLIMETNAVVDQDVWKSMQKMSSEIMLAVKYLIRMVENLKEVNQEIIKSIDAVNDQEKIVDGLYYSTIKQIHLSNMDPRAVMLSRDLVQALEMAADTCKNCADTITVIISSRRH
ncbi:MAG: DUF47 family protein [Candidatus Methanomethylophilaceae archaeon]|nr:DUF47 family protein [Candidatus Methanomethylophilaceae archaeon]